MKFAARYYDCSKSIESLSCNPPELPEEISVAHIKFRYAIQLTIFLLFSTVAHAQSDSDTLSKMAADRLDPNSEMNSSPICRGCHGQEGELNPLTGRVHHSNDAPDAVQLRSGPGDPVAGKEKSLLCQGCHGAEGISYDTKVPKLAGQYASYISKQLRNYQTGVRSHQIMNAMAATISDEDLDDISAYFASLPKMDGPDSKINHLGQKLFFHSDTSRAHMACVNCHGISGKGLTPETKMFPVIGGQHKDYLYAQLLSFKNDDRVNSPNAIMNKIARVLEDEELEALAEYLSEQ